MLKNRALNLKSPSGEYLFGIYITNLLPLPGYNLRLDLDSMNVKLQQNVGYKTTFERKGKFMSHGSLRDHPVEAGREKPMVRRRRFLISLGVAHCYSRGDIDAIEARTRRALDVCWVNSLPLSRDYQKDKECTTIHHR